MLITHTVDVWKSCTTWVVVCYSSHLWGFWIHFIDSWAYMSISSCVFWGYQANHPIFIIPDTRAGYKSMGFHLTLCLFLAQWLRSELVFCPAGATHEATKGDLEHKIPGSGQRFLVFFMLGKPPPIFISHEEFGQISYEVKGHWMKGLASLLILTVGLLNHLLTGIILRVDVGSWLGCRVLRQAVAGGGQHSIRWLVRNSIVWNVEEMCILKCDLLCHWQGPLGCTTHPARMPVANTLPPPENRPFQKEISSFNHQCSRANC